MSANHWITIVACILFAIFIVTFAIGTHSSKFEDEDISPNNDTYHDHNYKGDKPE